jgi:hypothetical protein
MVSLGRRPAAADATHGGGRWQSRNDRLHQGLAVGNLGCERRGNGRPAA